MFENNAAWQWIRAVLPHPRELIRIAPHRGDHHPALRMLLTTLIPCVLLVAIDHQKLLIAALLTTVVAAYGRRSTAQRRLVMQVEVALWQVFLVVLGTWVSIWGLYPAVVISLCALAASVSMVISERRRWQPTGALFQTFAFSVTAFSDNQGIGIAAIALVSAGSALIALVVTIVWSAKELLQLPVQLRAEVNSVMVDRVPWQLSMINAAICLVGGAAAGLFALSIGSNYPYWAVVAAVVPVFGAPTAVQLTRAGHRLGGTGLGIATSGLLFLLPVAGVAMIGMLLALMTLTELTIARNYSLALAFVTPMTFGFVLLGTPQSLGALMIDRIVVTSLGVVIAALLIIATHTIRGRYHEIR